MFEQDRFIVRLQQSVMRESDIEICFLSGAHGRRTEDAYSDLDVVLVFAGSAARDAAWARRRDFVRSILPYVPARSFDAGHLRPYLHIALYSNGAKVDYRYEAQDTIAPLPEDREIRILKDSEGWAETYQAASARIIPTQPRLEAGELERIDTRFWGLFWEVFRQLLRGDARTPFATYLELLYFTLPPLLRSLPPEDPAHQGLIEVHYTRDAGPTLRELRRLFDAYLAARSAVIRRYNVGYLPDSGFERGIQGLLDRYAGSRS
jgi:hypothetical protein